MTLAKSEAPGEQIAAALERSPLFGGLGEGERTELLKVARLRTLRPGEILWRAAERATHLGVVVAGRVALSRPGVDTDAVFDVAVEGELLGDVGFTLSSTYSATVFCPRRARVALIPARAVRAVLEREPAVTAALAVELAKRVTRLISRLEAVTAVSVDQRLARTLLELAEHTGRPFPGGVLIPVKLRRRDLASLAATTLETTSRKLSAWSARGVIQKQPAGLVIRDLDALAALSTGSSLRSP